MYKKNKIISSLGDIVHRKPNYLSMKLALALMFASVFQASAFTFGQTITLKKKNAKVTNVLKDIQKQSGYNIFYDSSFFPSNRVITVDFNKKPFEKALESILEDYAIDYNIVDKNVILKRKANAVRLENASSSAVKLVQQTQITGTVKNTEGESLSNVSITEKGGTASTMSDSQGNFQITVSKPDAILIISNIGYEKQEVSAANKSSIQITLHPTLTEVDEVVVVGYGEQKKVNLTGAVSQISGEEFEDRPVTQLTQALQGNVPNLNIVFGSGKPGTSGSVNIRGNTSINGGDPLILIDGILGTLDRVNVNDVESVTVLKDASAAAVYGARGAFGVILVTTKKGKVDGKAAIDYSTNYGFTTHSTNTDFITTGYWNAKINDDAMYNALGYRTTRYTDEDYEELLARVNDKTEDPSRPWVVTKKDASGNDIYRYYGNFDWFNYLYDNNRPKSDHNLSLSGMSGKTSYALSGALSNEQGIFNIQPDKFKRYNLRANISTEIRPWLTVSNGTHFFKSSYDWNGLENNFSQVANNVSNSPTYHYHAMYVPRNPDGTLTGYSGINSYPIGYGLHNALESGTMRGYDNGTEFTNKTEAIVNFGKGLTLTGNYSYREYRGEYSYRQTRQYYSKYPGVMELSSLGALNQDKLTERMTKYSWHFINIFANYQKSFGDHNIVAMAGFNQEDRIYKRVGGVGQDLLSENLNDLDLVIGEKQFNGGADEWAVRGGFYRLNYDYKGKYLFETSGRYDGTSRFPKSSRFGFFPSFSAGWRISEEKFFEPVKSSINNLKLRYSYGSLGNQEVDTYAYIASMGTGQINYLVDGQKLNVTYNPAPVARSLTWEKITTSNVGLDFSLLNNRLNVESDYYIRNTIGMLSVGETLPDVFGANEPKVNAADLRTKGFDLSLTWRDQLNLASKPFNYSVRAILSDYTSEITKFSNPAGLLNTYYEGQQLGEIWGYRYDGFFKTTEEAQAYAKTVNQDQINRRRVQAPTEDLRRLQAGDIKILDLNGDGIINAGKSTLEDPGDREIIGNSQPRYSYGLTFSANWNGIDASIFLQGIGRRNWYPNLETQAFWSVYARPYDSFIPSDFPDKIWSPENPNAYFPFLRGYTAQNSELSVNNDMYLQDLAYLKIRNLTVGYTFPTSLTNRIHVNKFRLFMSGENLVTWTKLKSDYIDPEQVMTDNTGRSYPMGKVVSFGAQLSF
ncbi:SusC/RagA family TonB-linked outer membrane protein [Sphingobacterium sp. DK4209]|uniref:SusC/RagA family TonB-linked outer membrane protein n=2 Tax=Sphingobacterium zhuxiongii TaxID=2662364 RepID=A0A5Q0QI19_9SPHI|nr:TonB-dependent receptor [Sphingobacterium sp. DK4209]MVZ66497.1 SusC/RagA family TonB-linked outer membrane protein [Sphingobacterium sp. DK4209]QGA27848.1 SusC/RagA family TonB-linked outer membrane protein [Sphingobacterium sp. dk4302]